MADSKHASPAAIADLRGLVTRAMAYRVKYRKTDANGKPAKKWIAILSLGVHPKNRGGVYPSGLRLTSLTTDVLSEGFSKDDCNHVVVGVEEIPFECASEAPKNYETMAAYNKRKCGLDALLACLFGDGNDEVRVGLLSHNHIALIMRAWLEHAKWDLPRDDKIKLTYCDADGRLDIAAVAGHPNATELVETLADGLFVEVLSYKINSEEPDAARDISLALNKGQAVALHATELTAIAVLKGEVVTQMSATVAQNVAFDTVRAKVRQALGTCADEPELVDLFDFLISLGVGKNTYVDEFFNFASAFVDSKKNGSCGGARSER